MFPNRLLAQGCSAQSTVGKPIDPLLITGNVITGLLRDENKDERRWVVGKESLDDQGEYDAIIDWEDHIAIELRELPRFTHG